MSRLRSLARAQWRTGLGVLVGGLGGAAYAHFIGCRTGTCPLTSNVWTAALYFGIAGAIVAMPGPRREEKRAGDRAGGGAGDR